jgi:hypothetical protein
MQVSPIVNQLQGTRLSIKISGLVHEKRKAVFHF